MAEEIERMTQDTALEGRPQEKSQIANMDYSDYLLMLMESRIIEPSA